ncbi:hypothetical protein M514_22889 [Trichuris suis]|uniref:Uncharacterized protein n=1 Tax=Trichuris suis TaxID=68888 RepID=A0A085N650_9BILA|nr:hypothetical protein M514_22889 [Trichuris suis]
MSSRIFVKCFHLVTAFRMNSQKYEFIMLLWVLLHRTLFSGLARAHRGSMSGISVSVTEWTMFNGWFTQPCNFEAEAQKSTNAELGAQALQRHLAALELKKNVTNFVKE